MARTTDEDRQALLRAHFSEHASRIAHPAACGKVRGRIDMATPYLREALRFIGIRSVQFVPVGPTTGPATPISAAREKAHRRLGELATRF